MKIIQLKAENIKKLKAIEINTDGNLVEITGKNAQGKTSVLDCILYALAGEKSIPEKVIRNGEDRAEIILDLGEYTVKRVFTSKGSRLEVTANNGASFKSPQSILDNITGKLSFDPLSFVNQDKKQKVETLKQLTGLDTTDLDVERKNIYDCRTETNKEIKRYSAIVGEEKDYSEVPDEEISAIEVINKIQRVKDHQEEVLSYELEINRNVEEIRLLEMKLEELKGYTREKETQLAELIAFKLPNIEELNIKLINFENTNRKVREKKEYNKNLSELNKHKEAGRDLTNNIELIDNKKQEMVKNTKMPVEGLMFDEENIFVNDILFENLNEAEKLKISLLIAMACNPVLKVIRVTNGSLLDTENIKIITEMIKNKDYQLWLERVDESGKVGIVIEDGEIKNG